jgi:hypothetical protein
MYNTVMLLQNLRRAFGLVLLVLSLVLLTWGLRSAEYLLQTTELEPADMALTGSDQPPAVTSSSVPLTRIPGPRLLELSWPKRLRLGDDGTLRLTVGLTSSLPAGSDRSQATPAGASGLQPGNNDGYNLVLKSHLDLPGMVRTPTGELSQTMLADQPVVFLWYLRASAAGFFSGKVWLHLHFVSRSTGGEERILLAAQQVDIQVVRLLGMSGSQARLFGTLGLVVGTFLGLDGVLSWCFKQLARRE